MHLFGADFLHLLFTVYTINNWYIYITPPPPAYTPTYCNRKFLRWGAWINNEMLLVGGVVRPQEQTTHPPTNNRKFLRWGAWINNEMLLVGGVVRPQEQTTHLPTNTRPATIQGFSADAHRLTVIAILRLILEQ